MNSLRRSLRLEPLESRNLLSVTLTPEGVLNVTGTNRADHIEIAMENNQLHVTLNKSQSTFDAASVRQIQVFGLKGDDSIQVADNVLISAVIDGGDGNDRIQGGGGNDVIHGGAGNDRISGGGGNDVLYGDSGNDKIDGGDGDDEIHGGSGNDAVFGGAGDDDLFGDAGNDRLKGDDGNDSLHGGAGNDLLWGGLGDDRLSGDAGNDVLDGGEGKNLLDGGSGKDQEKNGDSAELETELHAVLVSDTGMKVKASFETETEDGVTKSELEIKVSGGKLGDVLQVSVGDPAVVVGSITLDADGRGRLKLSSHPEDGDEQPLPDGLVIAVDTPLHVGTLDGKFSA